MEPVRIRVKEGVILHPAHWSSSVATILLAVVRYWPIPELVITRGCEAAPGSKPDSRHYLGEAFDFRCRTLPDGVDRPTLLTKILTLLGKSYYGYYKKTAETEWIHLQYNREE
jgi:hypothetical protein